MFPLTQAKHPKRKLLKIVGSFVLMQRGIRLGGDCKCGTERDEQNGEYLHRSSKLHRLVTNFHAYWRKQKHRERCLPQGCLIALLQNTVEANSGINRCKEEFPSCSQRLRFCLLLAFATSGPVVRMGYSDTFCR